jgi:hypothetical protein
MGSGLFRSISFTVVMNLREDTVTNGLIRVDDRCLLCHTSLVSLGNAAIGWMMGNQITMGVLHVLNTAVVFGYDSGLFLFFKHHVTGSTLAHSSGKWRIVLRQN